MSFTLIAGMTSIGVVGGFFAGLLGFGGGGSHVPPPLLHSTATGLGKDRCKDCCRSGSHTGIFLDFDRRVGALAPRSGLLGNLVTGKYPGL